jgi:hypothetical protein
MACLMTFFNAAAGNGSVSFRLMEPVPVLMRGYLALNSAMWGGAVGVQGDIVLLVGQGYFLGKYLTLFMVSKSES